MRIFTSDEKKLLTRIRDGHGLNLYSLIDPWINGVSFQVDTNIQSVDFIFESQKFNLNRLTEIQTLVIQSVNLIKLFEDKGFIFTFINANQLPSNPFVFGQAAINAPTIPYHFPDPRISELFCEYSVKEIIVTPELNKFIKDGFITREEVRANRQWLTTLAALFVTTISFLVNIYLNIQKSDNRNCSAKSNEKIQTQSLNNKTLLDLKCNGVDTNQKSRTLIYLQTDTETK